MIRRFRMIASVGACFVLMVAASSAWWPIYQHERFILVAVVTVALGCAVAAVGAAWRRSAIVVVAMTSGVFAVAGVALAVPDRTIAGVIPTSDGLVALALGATEGWKQLLTIALPVGSYQALVAPFVVTTLVASVVTTTVALRTRKYHWALVPPAVVVVLGIAWGPLTVCTPVITGVAGSVIAVLCGAVLRTCAPTARTSDGWRLSVARGGRRRQTTARRAIAAMIVSGAAVTAGVSAATALPPVANREVMRATIDQPFEPRSYPSPLTSFRSYREPELVDQPLFDVAGLPAGYRLRLATLDSYDGVVMSVSRGASRQETTTRPVSTLTAASGSGSFTRIPYRLDQGAAAGSEVALDVTVRGHAGVWVPGVGQLENIEFGGHDAQKLRGAFFYNDATGTAVVTTGLHDGDSYRALSIAVGVSNISDLSGESPGPAQLPIPEAVPSALTTATTGWSATQATPGGRLVAALSTLESHGYVSHGVGPGARTSLSGHGANRLSQLFTAQPMIGDQEQYAVAATLMARQLGFPARVAVGFAPATNDSRSQITIHGSEISAWSEVQTRESGWVAIDPTPPERPIPDADQHDPEPVSRPASISQPPPHRVPVEQSPPEPDNSEQPALPPADPLWAALATVLVIGGWSAALLAVCAAPFVTVIAIKGVRRRRRRRAQSGSCRVLGAWDEYRDRVIDLGVSVPVAATRSEIARLVSGSRPIALAEVADRAAFGPTPIEHDEAGRVWHAVDDLIAVIMGRYSRVQQFTSRVSLRSLRTYHRRRRG